MLAHQQLDPWEHNFPFKENEFKNAVNKLWPFCLCHNALHPPWKQWGRSCQWGSVRQWEWLPYQLQGRCRHCYPGRGNMSDPCIQQAGRGCHWQTHIDPGSESLNKIRTDKSNVKRRNTLSCLDQYMCRGWDCETVGTLKQSRYTCICRGWSPWKVRTIKQSR